MLHHGRKKQRIPDHELHLILKLFKNKICNIIAMYTKVLFVNNKSFLFKLVAVQYGPSYAVVRYCETPYGTK